jgi:putative ABC transport system permease protein
MTGRPGRVYSLRILTDQHDEAFQKRVGEQIQSIYESLGIQVNSVGLGAEFVRGQKAQTDILIYMMLVMSSFIAIVGGLGLTGTMSINVLERTREIGIMRAIGGSNMDIQSIVIIEGILIGVLSWAISVFFSIPITYILCFGVGMALLTTPMNAVYGLTGIFTWLVVTIILATIASALPARRASRLTVKDTLAYE